MGGRTDKGGGGNSWSRGGIARNSIKGKRFGNQKGAGETNRIELKHGCILLVGPKVEAIARAYEAEVPRHCVNRRRQRDGGCSHITLIHSKQLKSLEHKEGIPRTQILSIVKSLVPDPGMWHCHGLGKAEVENTCSSNGSQQGNDKKPRLQQRRTQTSFFAVLTWPFGDAVLRHFQLPPRYFHITLGFSGNDIHDVPKGRSTLLHDDTATLMILEFCEDITKLVGE